MSTATAHRRITAEEFAADPQYRGFELVDGEPVEIPVSVASSVSGGRLFGHLWPYCNSRDLGEVFPADTGIQCFRDDPDKVRKPDVCFVAKDRLTAAMYEASYLSIAPDLAVEVVSPNDLASALNTKVGEYLSAGVKLVWVIDPESRTAQVYRLDGTGSRLDEIDELDGESVVPGFRCRLADVLPPRPAATPSP